jgi:pre-mRNA-splicing helicase BRR2
VQQRFIGITKKKATKRYQIVNEVCYEKVLDQAGKNQTLAFVHSRKETLKAAKLSRDMAVEKESIVQYVKPDGAAREILTEEAWNVKDANVKDANLRDLLPFGFAIHHAGMSREEFRGPRPCRRIVCRRLYSSPHLHCNSRLGRNCPRMLLSPRAPKSITLKRVVRSNSSQDMLQMLGRAGRPQCDAFGEGVIVTNRSELQHYLSLLNQQLPIESQSVSKLVDNLNAEIALGTVRNRDEDTPVCSVTFFCISISYSYYST